MKHADIKPHTDYYYDKTPTWRDNDSFHTMRVRFDGDPVRYRKSGNGNWADRPFVPDPRGVWVRGSGVPALDPDSTARPVYIRPLQIRGEWEPVRTEVLAYRQARQDKDQAELQARREVRYRGARAADRARRAGLPAAVTGDGSDLIVPADGVNDLLDLIDELREQLRCSTPVT